MTEIDLTRLGVGLLQLLDEASTNGTYKYALLLALTDAAAENVGCQGGSVGFVTTEELARRVIALYWPQSEVWPGNGERPVPSLLRAVAHGRSIVDLIASAREGTNRPASPERLEMQEPGRWASLLRATETRLIQYPIPQLQMIGEEPIDLLYDSALWPRKGVGLQLGTYFRRRHAGRVSSSFDNQVVFLPGVEEGLARIAPLLRPLVMDRWARWTERANRLQGESSVFDFLFGVDRASLNRVRPGLRDLQDRRCFYCGETLSSRIDVDHFVPWSRTGCNDLFNLVASHPGCNSAKSDYLAAKIHVEAWLDRLNTTGDSIRQLATRTKWAADPMHARRVAASAYWSAGDYSRLWRQGRQFEKSDLELAKLLRA